MGKRSNRGRSKPQASAGAVKPKKWWIGLGALVVIPAIVWGTRALSKPGSIAIDDAVQIADGELLLVGTSGRDTDIRRSGRIMLLGADGTVTMRVDQEGAFRLIGIAGDVLWLENPKLGVHARKLSDLAVIDTSAGKLAQTPALKASARALGMADGKVVLEGADRFLYTLAVDGTVEKQPKDFSYARHGSPEALAPADAPLPEHCTPRGDNARDLIGVLEKTMSHAVPVACGRGHGLIAFDDPPGRLVLHTSFDDSGQIWQLSRVDLAGAVAWTASVPALIADAPFEDDGATTVPWVGFLGGELRAIVQSERVERSGRQDDTRDYIIVEHRLARIDSRSGAPLGATPLEVPET
jgi:hypothetical protein